MKKVFLLILALVVVAFAAQPSVTTTKLTGNSRYYILEFSYATAIASADSAFVYPTEAEGPLDVSEFGIADSILTLELQSSEGTADSIRHTVLVQVTSDPSPAEADWKTIVTDATSFTNTATGAHVAIRLRQLTACLYMRFIVFENDTNKDATQTVTGRLTARRK